MTFKLFNRSLAFNFRNGCGIDLEFHEGKAVWISQTIDDDIEAGVFVGAIVLLPFFSITFGKCYTQQEEF